MLRAIKRLDEETPLRYVPTFLGAHDIPPEYQSRRDEYVSLIIDEMLPRVAQEKLAEYCDVFCEAESLHDRRVARNSFGRALSRAWTCAFTPISFRFPAEQSWQPN